MQDRWWARSRVWWVFVLAVAALLLWSVATPRFAGYDERAHLGYAALVVHGRLPTVDTPVPPSSFAADLDVPPRERNVLDGTDDVWVANHPPLPYLLAAPFVRSTGLGALRAINLLMAAIGLAVLAAVIRELEPDLQVVWVTVGLVALCPQFLGKMSLGYNDGTAFAASMLILWSSVSVFRRGQSWGALLALAAGSTVGVLTRASLLPLVAIGIGCWVWVAWRRAHDLRAALVGAGTVALGCAAVAGWFYLRNVRLYGDLTGGDALFDKFDRTRYGSIVDVWTTPRWLVGLWQELWGAARPELAVGSGHLTIGSPTFSFGSNLVVGMALLGLALLGAKSGPSAAPRLPPRDEGSPRGLVGRGRPADLVVHRGRRHAPPPLSLSGATGGGARARSWVAEVGRSRVPRSARRAGCGGCRAARPHRLAVRADVHVVGRSGPDRRRRRVRPDDRLDGPPPSGRPGESVRTLT
jgi:hypothetical protein